MIVRIWEIGILYQRPSAHAWRSYTAQIHIGRSYTTQMSHWKITHHSNVTLEDHTQLKCHAGRSYQQKRHPGRSCITQTSRYKIKHNTNVTLLDQTITQTSRWKITPNSNAETTTATKIYAVAYYCCICCKNNLSKPADSNTWTPSSNTWTNGEMRSLLRLEDGHQKKKNGLQEPFLVCLSWMIVKFSSLALSLYTHSLLLSWCFEPSKHIGLYQGWKENNTSEINERLWIIVQTFSFAGCIAESQGCKRPRCTLNTPEQNTLWMVGHNLLSLKKKKKRKER